MPPNDINQLLTDFTKPDAATSDVGQSVITQLHKRAQQAAGIQTVFEAEQALNGEWAALQRYGQQIAQARHEIHLLAEVASAVKDVNTPHAARQVLERQITSILKHFGAKPWRTNIAFADALSNAFSILGHLRQRIT